MGSGLKKESREGKVKGLLVTPQRKIEVEGGEVFHAMRMRETGYSGFGEAYFSFIEFGAVKAWKRHREMTLNIIVPIGEIRFIIFDDRSKGTDPVYQQIILSPENYCRLTVPPMVWMGFQGISKEAKSILLNIASIPHDPGEADRKPIHDVEFDWSLR